MALIYLLCSHVEKNTYTGAKIRRAGFATSTTNHKVIEIVRKNRSVASFLSYCFQLIILTWTLSRRESIIVINEGIIPVFNFKNANKSLFLIHDLKNQSQYSRRYRYLRNVYYKFMVAAHDAVLTVSYTEKENLEQYFSNKPIFVSYNGVRREFLAKERIRPEKIYDFIYVSNFTRHKNHKFLTSKYFQGLNVLCIGKNLNLKAREYAELENKFTIKNDLTVDELVYWYSASEALIFPSYLEGFGIPLVEAYSLGLQIYASDLPVFHEILSKTGGFIIDHNAKKLKILYEYSTSVPPDYFSWNASVERLVSDLFK